jgi:hypothetical protein
MRGRTRHAAELQGTIAVLCFRRSVSFATQAELIVATLDLQTVRLIRDAMARTELAADVALDRLCFLDRPVIWPEPLFEPRVVIEPTPRFEPRPVIYPRPRVAPEPVPAPTAAVVERKPALEPPWSVAPWKMPIQPAPKIKINIHRTDVISKGSLLDFFI